MIIRIKESCRPVFAKSKIIFGFQSDSIEMDNDPEISDFIRLLAKGCSLEELYEKAAFEKNDVDEMIEALDDYALLEDIEKYDRYAMVDSRYKTNLQHFSCYANLHTSKYEFQQRLNEATVFLIGAGGSILTALALVGMGIGKLILLDCDRIETGNLSRQLIYTEKDIGRRKTDAAKEALQNINGNLEIETVDMRVENAACLMPYVEKADIVINAIDTPPIHAARWVNYACMKAGKPLLQGGVSPQTIVVDSFTREDGCFDCYLLSALRQDPAFADQLKFLLENNDDTLDFNTSYAPNISLLAWALGSEAGKRIARYAEPLVISDSLRINVDTLEKKWINNHRKMTECPSCSGRFDASEPVLLEEIMELSRK